MNMFTMLQLLLKLKAAMSVVVKNDEKLIKEIEEKYMEDVVIKMGNDDNAASKNKMMKYLERDERWTLVMEQTRKTIFSNIVRRFSIKK